MMGLLDHVTPLSFTGGGRSVALRELKIERGVSILFQISESNLAGVLLSAFWVAELL